MTESINIIEQAKNQDTTAFSNFPIEGMGKRAMGCKMYDKCLFKAAVNDWYSFNCDGCNYEGQCALEFIDSAFIPELDDSDLPFEDDIEMELVDLSVNLQSMFYLHAVLECHEHTS